MHKKSDSHFRAAGPEEISAPVDEISAPELVLACFDPEIRVKYYYTRMSFFTAVRNRQQ